MQDKIELFNDLPRSIKKEVLRHSSNRDLGSITMTSKEHWTFFKPMLDVRKFLRHVVHGEYDAVQLMLKNDMSLIFKRGSVTDYSGRTFEDISGLEYALWALDEPMWTMMRECIPQNEEGKKVLEQMLLQYNKINTDGVTYRYDGRTITESHFDFKNTIIHELQKHTDSRTAPGFKDWDAIDNQWRTGVGGAQKKLPVSFVFPWCSDRPFYPTLAPITERESSQQFYNTITKKIENWFDSDSGLGKDFAIVKGLRGPDDVGQAAQGRPGRVAGDLEPVVALYKEREEAFNNLKSQLEEQKKAVDNQTQVSQM